MDGREGLAVSARFPCEVPPRPTAGIRNAPEGVDEGAMCLRAFGHGLASVCLARLVLEPEPDMGGCSCFISAPCGMRQLHEPRAGMPEGMLAGRERDESRP